MSPLSSRAGRPGGWRGRRGWRGWERRTEVERVRLYTVTLLEVMVWLALLLVALAGLSAPPAAAAVTMTVAGVLLTVAATRLLRHAATAYPTEGGPDRGPATTLVVLAIAGTGVALLLPGDFRPALAGIVATGLVVAFAGYRDRRVAVAMMAGVVAAALVAEPTWVAVGYALLVGGFVAFTVRSSLWLLAVVTELDRARGTRAALAVAEERLRFSRDVHDVLGRRLSTIALQAELAAALARRGDPTAADRMGEVRGTAHEALREARELARGYRPTSLAQELDGARSLLGAAGIACTVDVAGLPERWHEPAAWVVREAVTNVLRHSTARTVTIGYRPAGPAGGGGGVLSVGNDGAAGASESTGSGLAGLAERLAPLGAGLEAVRDGATYTLRVTVPTEPAPVGEGVR